jgi:hypothetical protein
MTMHRSVMKILLLLCLLVVCDAAGAKADKRQREREVRSAINAALFSLNRGYYKARNVVDIDSLLGDMRYFQEPLEDPYGTLRNCFVFTTTAKDTTVADPTSIPEGDVVGIFRDGRILAISEGVTGDFDGRLFTTRDINNDGTVEIVTEWGTDTRDHTSLWIHSWDGATLRRVNAIEDRWVEGDRSDV